MLREEGNEQVCYLTTSKSFWKPTKQPKMEVSPKCGAKGICSQLGRNDHYKSRCLPPHRDAVPNCQNSASLSVDLHFPLGGTSGTG